MLGLDHRRRNPRGPSGRTPAVVAALLLAACLLLVPGDRPALAQAAGAAPSGAPAPEDLRTLSDLLDKPAVRAWLKAQSATPSTAPAAPAEPGPRPASEMMGSRLDAMRASLRDLAAAIPDLPRQGAIMRDTLVAELRSRGPAAIVLPVLAFAALGWLVQALFWRATAGLRHRMIALPVDTVQERLHAIGWRTLYGVGVVAAFAAGSVGAFLAFDWPPLLQRIVLAYLLVVLAVRLVLVAGRIVLAPGAERFRMVPMATHAAAYWFVWSAVLVGTYAAIKATFDLVPALGADADARRLIGAGLGLALLVLVLVALWRRPARDGGQPARRSHDGIAWLATVYLVGLWLSTFLGTAVPFFVGVVLLILVLGNLGLRLAVGHLMRPSTEPGAASVTRPLSVVAFDRGLRLLLLLAAAALIARILDLDATMLTANDGPATRIGRGLVKVVVIALVAEFAWQAARAWIDHRLDAAGAVGATGSDDDLRRRQRLRTLLPILRNVVLIVLVVVAGMTALSTVGVEIGPLVAGAGVVGIAVGFGAQTLVKDVISGMFFLLDDAFRVGEYIESGRIKGTVETFSLRSIKLRHHRGPLHTVPFGALSTITNYSRDWVIDKMSIGVTYDTDLDAVKRIVKDIGRALQEDPEFAPHILETLKMQGVDAFGDFAIQIRLKMMTRPGEQFVIRRRAYAMIKRAFDQAGVQFAFPTVTVAGGTAAEVQAAAAQAGLVPRPPEALPAAQ